jgi:hypothetical protein
MNVKPSSKPSFHTRASVFLAAALIPAVCALAQDAPPTDLRVTATSYVQYPSLNPVSAISMHVGDFGTSIYDILQAESANPNWSCASAAFYQVAVVDKAHKVLRQLNVSAVRPIGYGPDGQRYTHCEKGHPAIVDLVLASAVKSGDLIQVFVYEDAKHTKLLISSDGTLAATATTETAFTATPQAAPGEALNNGATRTVGQLNLAFADTNLIKKSPIDLYIKSTDLFSTDGKDSKSAFAATLGIQRGLFDSWYSPWHLEQAVQGNQTAKNLSAVTSLGLTTLPPWRWTRSILNNSVILAPLPPEPSLAGLYTHRINQLVTKKTPLLAVDDFSVNPVFSWSTISFPFTCKLFFWQKPAPSTKGATPEAVNPDKKAAATPRTPTCLGTELDLGLWYLPLNHTSTGSQRVDGYGDISILVPLSDFSVATKQLTYVTKGDSTKFQLRIKYADSVNAANNYARTRQWTFGLEALK